MSCQTEDTHTILCTENSCKEKKFKSRLIVIRTNSMMRLVSFLIVTERKGLKVD